MQIDEAERAQVISKAEANSLREYHAKVAALVDVDEFAPGEFLHRPDRPGPEPVKTTSDKPATKKKAPRKKAAKKKAAKKKTAKT